MKESYNDDQPDFIQYNSPFQKSKINQITIQSSNTLSEFTILLRFSKSKSFSFQIPNSWTTKKLISFILQTFKSEILNSIPNFIYKGNIMQPFDESLLKEYFDPSKINHIIVSLKIKEKNSPKEETSNRINKNILENIYSKSNKEVFKTDEFCELEKYVMEDYNRIFKENSLNNFPLMSPAYNQRREQIKFDPQTEKFATFEPVPLEDFPIRNYFQLKIIFKCIISFFVFGIYIKGFNFVLFLCVLIGYYWYCINNIIEEFYKKKFQEIGLNEEEYKRIGEEIKEIGYKLGGVDIDKDEYEEVEEGGESDNESKESKDENNNEDIIYEEKSDENVSSSNNISNINNINNINKEANNNINLDIEEDIKEINDKEDKINNSKEPIKDLEFEEDKKIEEIRKENPELIKNNNKSNENKNEININNNRIKNQIKKNKKKEIKKEEPEQETALQIAYQILYLFVISFIPPWCDEFEAHNPMPSNNQHHRNNNNNENNNNVNQNNNDININNENNFNNNNLFNNNNINDINIGQESSNSPQQEEDSNNNKMTSSKVVNMSDGSENKKYHLLKKDNQSLNENEYVFSENGPIDSLSMNSELYKQKKEQEKEKEKANENKDKEKIEIENEKENILEEEDKHIKNE